MKEPTMISKMRCGRCGKLMAGMGVLLFALLLVAPMAQAMIINTGNSNLDVRFDNTLTYSTMLRLEDQDPDLIADPNSDDGDRNFDKGLVMNRLDLLSEFDLSYNKFGVRFSGAAWYDQVYMTDNDNDSEGTISYTSVPHDEFTEDTEEIHGSDVELLEAFTFGSFDVGNVSLRYRAGQFSQWWGDSLFFGWNGVAGALAPVDVSKAATLPNTQGRELVRPIPQVSLQVQPLDNLSFSGYYQFKWEPSKFFGVGSFFSPVDLLSTGAERLITPPEALGIVNEITGEEPSDDGQFGIMTKFDTMFATYGLYYANFHSKGFLGPVINPIEHTYYRFYPEDIELMAASMNFAVDQYTFATEVTYMTNVPFHYNEDEALMLMTVFPDSFPAAMFPHDPMYPTGDTLSINVNTFSGGMAGNFFCDSQDLLAEIAYVKELSVDNEAWVNRDSYEKDGLKVMAVYTPTWYQVAPGLDLTLPMGVGYTFKGAATSALWDGGAEDQGDFNIGVGATYNVVWHCELMYRHYMGDTDVQAFADRDYVSFYIRRAF